MDLGTDVPIVQAPLAGGPSTPALTATVTEAGGFGFVAGGALSVDALIGDVRATRGLTGRPFGVNLFVPSQPGDAAAIRAYADVLRPEAERLGTTLGEPAWNDDDYPAKLDALLAERPHTISFTFGCPDPFDIERTHSHDCRVVVTVTSVGEAVWAFEAGADWLVVQGTEAGGHQSRFLDDGPNTAPLLELVAEVRATLPLPLIAAGGVMTAADVAAAMAAGASAVQIGTALLCTPEAATSAVHRDALLTARFDDTVLTRAYTGRYARGLANRFGRTYADAAPAAFPEVHNLTRPLRAAAAKAGDAEIPNLWAGTGWRQVVAQPAADVIRRLAAGAR